MMMRPFFLFFFFFNDTATTEIYTLSLHDALPICSAQWTRITPSRLSHPRDQLPANFVRSLVVDQTGALYAGTDRKSTRLNSSHLVISYAVFCLKKKKKSSFGHSATDP